MSIEEIKANAEELHYCAYTVFGIYREIKCLSNAMEYPHLFELLQREHSLEELERAEALLSVCISQLRVKKAIERNEAIIIDLTSRLHK